MMTGIENYRRAIEFKGPEYLPCTIGVDLDWLHEKNDAKTGRIRKLAARFPDDILSVSAVGKDTEREVRGGVVRWKDEWQTGWEDDGHGAKTESYPLSEGYETLASFVFPDSHLAGRFDDADEQLKERESRYVQAGVWFTLFERLWMLRGFENMLMNPYTH